jgi:hypothetical protein
MDSLGDFLADLKEQGTFDSSGRFSLSLAQAFHKMQQFQLAEPHRYLLNLVAWVVASGATFLHIQAGLTRTVMEHDGVPPTFKELGELFSAVADAGGGIPNRELAIGLHGARATSPRSISLAAWNEPEGALLNLVPQYLEVAPLRASPFGTSRVRARLCIRERPDRFSFGRLLGRLTRARPPLLDAVIAECGLAPLAIQINGESINRTLALGTCTSVRLVDPIEAGPGLPAADLGRVRFIGPSPDRSRQSGAGWSGILTLGQTSGWGHHLHLVVNGLSFCLEGAEVGYPEARGLIFAPGLRKDLSQSNLVEGLEYQALLTSLREAFLSLAG